MAKKMWMKIVKKWGEHEIGDVRLFDQSKAKDLMAQGILIQAKSPKTERVKVEATVAPPVNPETAMIDNKPEAKTEVDKAETKPTERKSRFGKGRRG